MNSIQHLSAKLGEVTFRQKLVMQHKGVKTYYPTHTTAEENLQLLKERAVRTEIIIKELRKKGVKFSPFVELGGEKCERAAVLSSRMKEKGFVVDISAESLESAPYFCTRLKLNSLPIRICADAYNLPFADNSISFVFAFQTLHHFPNPHPIMKEIYRVLAPGGYFYFDEEPVKPKIQIILWRRDYHLRFWEKILKAFLILPFISFIGKSEVSEGVLEETFDLKTGKRAVNSFDRVEGELIPYPLGPNTKFKKHKLNWLKAGGLTRLIISLSGGTIKALCGKKGELKVKTGKITNLLICPTCKERLNKKLNFFKCLNCKINYPIKNQIIYLLPKNLMKNLYPLLL